ASGRRAARTGHEVARTAFHDGAGFAACAARVEFAAIESLLARFSTFEHDLVGKPVPTFPDHALVQARAQFFGSMKPAKKAASSAWASSGSTCATYWSGRTTMTH